MGLLNLFTKNKSNENKLKNIVDMIKSGTSDSKIAKLVATSSKSGNPLSIPYTVDAALTDISSIQHYMNMYNPDDSGIANIVALHLYHVPYKKIPDIVSEAGYVPTTKDQLTFMGTFCTTQNCLKEFRETGIPKYEVSTCGDQRTCKICAKHNGKKYFVSKAEVGKNIPPFCSKCRCIILPVFK